MAIYRRYSNALMSAASFMVSSATGRPVVYGMPPAIGVELTNHCNLGCPECPSGSGTMKREKGFMDIGLFRKLKGELGEYLVNVNLYFQGEPMLHPGFFSFVEECRGLKTVISTNGHFLDAGNAARLAGSSLGKLIVSLDGMDQGTYSKYRKNGRIEEVINGIKLLTDAKKHSGSGPQVIIQFLVNRYNEEQVELARKFARENGCLLSLKSMQVIDPDEAGLWMPSGKKYRRYELKDGKYAIRNTFPRYCGRLWMNPVITWDGKVLPCCFDKDAGYVMGDLNTGSFSSIWKGERYMKFRRDLLTGREKLAMCRNCTSGLRGIKK